MCDGNNLVHAHNPQTSSREPTDAHTCKQTQTQALTTCEASSVHYPIGCPEYRTRVCSFVISDRYFMTSRYWALQCQRQYNGVGQ